MVSSCAGCAARLIHCSSKAGAAATLLPAGTAAAYAEEEEAAAAATSAADAHDEAGGSATGVGSADADEGDGVSEKASANGCARGLESGAAAGATATATATPALPAAADAAAAAKAGDGPKPGGARLSLPPWAERDRCISPLLIAHCWRAARAEKEAGCAFAFFSVFCFFASLRGGTPAAGVHSGARTAVCSSTALARSLTERARGER